MLRFRLFRPAPSPVLFDIAAHRPGFASALGHPAGTVLRFLVFRQVWALFRLISQHTDAGLGFMLVDAHLSAPHPHPLTCCRCLILSPPVAIADLCAAFSGFSAGFVPCFA